MISEVFIYFGKIMVMPTLPSLFRKLEGQVAYESAYQAALAQWPAPFETQVTETRFGRTFAILSGASDAPPLVLLHGFSASSMMWLPNAIELCRHFRLIALDTLGDVGQSWPVSPPTSEAEAAEWLELTLNQLEVEQACLAGHSYGGYLAVNLARHRPQRVRKLVLLAPGATLLPISNAFWLRVYAIMVFPSRWSAQIMLRWIFSTGYYRAEHPALDVLRLALQYGRPQVQLMPRVWEDAELGRLRTPTLLLIGEHERIYNPLRAVQRARLWMPDVQADLLPNASHALTAEQAGPVNHKMINFLLA